MSLPGESPRLPHITYIPVLLLDNSLSYLSLNAGGVCAYPLISLSFSHHSHRILPIAIIDCTLHTADFFGPRTKHRKYPLACILSERWGRRGDDPFRRTLNTREHFGIGRIGARYRSYPLSTNIFDFFPD